jgi:hypothetical protein
MFLERSGYQGQRTDELKPADAPDNLFVPLRTARATEGTHPGRSFSAYTWLRLHSALAAGAALTGASLLLARRRTRRGD